MNINIASEIIFSEDSSLGSPINDNQTKQRLKSWLLDQLDRETCPGCEWLDKKSGLFKLVWKHFGRPGFDEEKDAKLFREWAIHKRKYNPGNPSEVSIWKTRFRNALHKMQKDLEEVHEMHQLEGTQPYRVYRFRSTGEITNYKKEAKNNNMDDQSTCRYKDSLHFDSIERKEIEVLAEQLKQTKKDSDIDFSHPQVSNDEDNMQAVMEFIKNIDDLGTKENDFTNTAAPNQVIPMTGMAAKLYFSENEIVSLCLDNTNGVRIAYRPPPPVPTGMVDQHGARELITEIFGPLDAHQVYYPCSGENINRQSILNKMQRGLVIECDTNGDVYATRLCLARIFYNPNPVFQPINLERAKKTLIFSFQDFLFNLEEFKSGLTVTPPSYDMYFSFGEKWSHVYPIKELCVHGVVTHSLSKKILTDVKETCFTKEIILSGKGFWDEMKDRLEKIVLGEQGCNESELGQNETSFEESYPQCIGS